MIKYNNILTWWCWVLLYLSSFQTSPTRTPHSLHTAGQSGHLCLFWDSFFMETDYSIFCINLHITLPHYTCPFSDVKKNFLLLCVLLHSKYSMSIKILSSQVNSSKIKLNVLRERENIKDLIAPVINAQSIVVCGCIKSQVCLVLCPMRREHCIECWYWLKYVNSAEK